MESSDLSHSTPSLVRRARKVERQIILQLAHVCVEGENITDVDRVLQVLERCEDATLELCDALTEDGITVGSGRLYPSGIFGGCLGAGKMSSSMTPLGTCVSQTRSSMTAGRPVLRARALSRK